MRLRRFLLLGSLALASPTQGKDAVAESLEQAIQAGQSPGAVLWLDAHGREQRWALGQRSKVPAEEVMTEDTVFDLASLTKVVATLPSVLRLYELGKIDLEAPVRHYLNDFANGEVTVRQLLTHTSGLPAGLPKDDALPPWMGYTEGVRRACACVPDPAPGCGFRYSDVNFILLGEIVRRVSGVSLDQFARREVFEPLQMTSTGFKPEPALLARIAPTEPDEAGVMLRGVVHDPTARRMGGLAGHAGLFSSAGDLARYARMMLRGEVDGVRLFKPETLQRMRSVQTPATVYERRGLGWDIDSKYSRPRGGLFPLGSYGHTGWTGTALWMDPVNDVFYVLLTTRLHPNGKGNVRDLYEQIGTLVAREAAVKKSAPLIWPRAEREVPAVLNGIDVLKRQRFATVQGLRLGLITNQTGVDNERNATIDLLARAPGVQLRLLFSPEHGIRGDLDQEKIDDTRDAKTGLPVVSLYSDKKRVPADEDLSGIDALVFDIQDMGCRFYTYIATLKNCLEAAAKANKVFIVLDRVNPIRGDQIEGPDEVAKPAFTAIHALPVRHGMTVGELARLFAAEMGLKVELRVVQVEGWQRGLWFDATGLPWQNPSPNLRNLNAAMLYPGIGLLEYAISVGRGTDTPFERIGAPFCDDRVLAHELNGLGLPGLRFVPVRFTPTTSVFAKKPCGGVQLIITNRDALRPVTVGLAIAHTLHRLYPKDLDMEKLNTLLNHPATIEQLRNDKSWQALVASWQLRAQAFAERRKPFLLY